MINISNKISKYNVIYSKKIAYDNLSIVSKNNIIYNLIFKSN